MRTGGGHFRLNKPFPSPTRLARAPRTLRLTPVQPLNLRRTLAVEAGLFGEAGTELRERGDESVDLVQRVLDIELGVELELELIRLAQFAISRMIRGRGLT